MAERRLAKFVGRPLILALPVGVLLVLAAGWALYDWSFPPQGASAAASEPSATAEEHRLWTCGMHPQVLQDRPGVCPICGMALVPVNAAGKKPGAASAERRIRYWWDPMMNPPYISDQPGKSPMGMDLVPVYDDEVAAGAAVVIDPVVVQNMGVRTAEVTEGALHRTLRAVGYIDEAEPRQVDVNLRVSGWIVRLHADTVGMHVEKGQPLFDLYSPELQIGIGELIAARRARDAEGPGGNPEVRGAAEGVYGAAERKLRLWGLDAEQVERFAALDRPPETVTFRSPIHGHLMMRPIVAGAAVEAGQRALRIVDHSVLWLDARVFEQQLPFVRVGQGIRATVVSMPGESFAGKVTFIHPHVDPKTRTALVRTEIPNPSLELRPGMYATVEIDSELAERTLLVPRAAVIDTGLRQIVFVALPAGHFEPRKVEIGLSGDEGVVQIRSGLAPGESVVTSGQFLLDAESRLREAIEKFLSERLVKPAAQ